MQWRMTDAKNRFSELVERALSEGPQVILAGGNALVVLDRREHEKLAGKRPSFKQFLMGPGPRLTKVSFTRDRAPTRRVNL